MTQKGKSNRKYMQKNPELLKIVIQNFSIRHDYKTNSWILEEPGNLLKKSGKHMNKGH